MGAAFQYHSPEPAPSRLYKSFDSTLDRFYDGLKYRLPMAARFEIGRKGSFVRPM